MQKSYISRKSESCHNLTYEELKLAKHSAKPFDAIGHNLTYEELKL